MALCARLIRWYIGPLTQRACFQYSSDLAHRTSLVTRRTTFL
jgi:hypothetical protein